MKNELMKLLMAGLLVPGTTLFGADERPIISGADTVRVQYQIKSSGANAWTTSSTTLKGATTESMMVNTLSARHPRAQVRILSVAFPGRTERISVRYQLRRNDAASWTTGSTVLNNALTESMARNQLSVRHPGMEIRILSMVRQ